LTLDDHKRQAIWKSALETGLDDQRIARHQLEMVVETTPVMKPLAHQAGLGYQHLGVRDFGTDDAHLAHQKG
jgi:hypothetical protein